MLTCEVAMAADEPEWQEFCAVRPCSVYHHIAWKHVIENAYGHRSFYLVAKRDGKISGILPLVAIRSRLFGRSLTSLPFLDFAGIVAADEASHAALLEKAMELARQLRVDYIELRQTEASKGAFQDSTHKVLMTLALESDEEGAWAKLSSERRNRVRRAQKSGLTFEAGGPALLSTFYDIWTRNMRDLGSPPHSLRFFAEVIERFRDHCSILLVRHKDEFIGSALAFFWKDTMSVPWVSSLREHFQLYPNNVLYWEAIRMAVARGMKTFDFGRSSVGSGTFEFKQRWGAAAMPLHWQVISFGSKTVASSSDADDYRLAVEIWKRLPVSITRLVGPVLRKNITA